MKIDSSLIRSVEVVNKPDGRYIRIGYVKPESSISKAWRKTREDVKRAWRNEIIRTIATATTMVVLLELIKAMAGM